MKAQNYKRKPGETMKNNALTIAFVVQLTFCSPLFAADWDTACTDRLDDLRQAVGDAEDTARNVDSRADDYEQCKLLPITDLWNDGCRTRGSGYRYELANLHAALDTVNEHIRSVTRSCAMPVSTLKLPKAAQDAGNDR